MLSVIKLEPSVQPKRCYAATCAREGISMLCQQIEHCPTPLSSARHEKLQGPAVSWWATANTGVML